MWFKVKTYVASALLLFASTLAAAQATQGASVDWRDPPGPWHMWWGGGGLSWIFPLLMMVFIIAACAFFMTRMFGRRFRGDDTGSAIRLLNERFAKGEISKEEFEEKRTILVRHP